MCIYICICIYVYVYIYVHMYMNVTYVWVGRASPSPDTPPEVYEGLCPSSSPPKHIKTTGAGHSQATSKNDFPPTGPEPCFHPPGPKS